jgi:hypothetical protein
MHREIPASTWARLATFAGRMAVAAKTSGKATGKATGKAAHAGHAGSHRSGGGGCGTGAGGFRAGNTCGSHGHRNATVTAARSAHTQASRAARAHVKAGTILSAEGRAALKHAAGKHRELQAARAEHRENKRVARNEAARGRRAIASGKASAIHARPSRPSSSQAHSPPTDKGSRNGRLGVLAARHAAKARSLSVQAQARYDAGQRHQEAASHGTGGRHVRSPKAEAEMAAGAELSRRSGLHQRMSHRLGQEVVDPAKAAAAGRTLKSLGGLPQGHPTVVGAIEKVRRPLTKAELFKAAEHAGVGHGGARTKDELVGHLKASVGKAADVSPPVAVRPPSPKVDAATALRMRQMETRNAARRIEQRGQAERKAAKGKAAAPAAVKPSLREQADKHRTARAEQIKVKSGHANSHRPASEFRQRRADALKSVREQAIRSAAGGRQSLTRRIADLKSYASPGSALDRGVRYAEKLLESRRLKPSRRP